MLAGDSWSTLGWGMQADAFGGLGALPTVMLLDEHLGCQDRPELFDHDIMCVPLGNGRGLLHW